MRADISGCLATVVLLALSACAGAPPARDEAPPAMSADVLSRLAQHHVQDVYGVMGAPGAIAKASDGVNYVWNLSEKSRSFVPNSSAATSGFIGMPPAGTDTSSGGSVEHDITCRLRITADATNLIRHLDFNGPHSACDLVGRQLADWIRSVG